MNLTIISAQAKMLPYIVQEPEDEQSSYQDLSVVTLPVLARCIIDENNNPKKVLEVMHLTISDLEEILEFFEEVNALGDLPEQGSFNTGLGRMFNGTKDFCHGFFIVTREGGKYMLPKVIDFSKGTYTFLLECYKDFISQ